MRGGSGCAAVPRLEEEESLSWCTAGQQLCNALRAVAVVTASDTASTANQGCARQSRRPGSYFQLPSGHVSANGSFVQMRGILMASRLLLLEAAALEVSGYTVSYKGFLKTGLCTLNMNNGCRLPFILQRN